MSLLHPTLHGIRCEARAYEGSFAADAEAAQIALQNDEPAKSTFYTIDAFVIPRRAYQRAVRETGALTEATAGPFSLIPEDNWHRDDFPEFQFQRKYLATLYGPGTRFLEGDFRDGHFDRDMLAGVPEGPMTEMPHFLISLHNKSTTVHAAPSEAHTGEGRITVSASIILKESMA